MTNEYPPDSLGYKMDEIERRIQELPWPFRFVMQRRLNKLRSTAASYRDSVLEEMGIIPKVKR